MATTELLPNLHLQAGPAPNFTDVERELHAQVAHALPPAPPCRVDRELVDRAALSFHALAELEAEVACFGHGRPVVGNASATLAAASINLISSDSDP